RGCAASVPPRRTESGGHSGSAGREGTRSLAVRSRRRVKAAAIAGASREARRGSAVSVVAPLGLREVAEVVVRQVVGADVVERLVEGGGELAEVLLVEEHAVLLVAALVHPLALRDDDEDVLAGARLLHVEEVGAASGRNAPGVEPIAAIVPVVVVVVRHERGASGSKRRSRICEAPRTYQNAGGPRFSAGAGGSTPRATGSRTGWRRWRRSRSAQCSSRWTRRTRRPPASARRPCARAQ